MGDAHTIKGEEWSGAEKLTSTAKMPPSIEKITLPLNADADAVCDLCLVTHTLDLPETTRAKQATKTRTKNEVIYGHEKRYDSRLDTFETGLLIHPV